MFWLGFILPVVYVPSWTGATILSGWPFLSLILPLLLLRKIEMGPAHWLGLAFLAYACVALSWAPVWQQGIWDLWLTFILAGVFCWASGLTSTRALWLGMAIGLGINDVIATLQLFKFNPVPVQSVGSGYYPGLFINQDMFCEASLFVTLGLVGYRLYWPLVFTLPPLYFAQTRSVFAAYAIVAAVAAWDRWRWITIIPSLFVVLCVGYAVTARHHDSITEHFELWQDTADGQTLWGRGPGSFFMLYPEFAKRTDTMRTRPEDPHNEYLNLSFQYGLGILPLAAIFAIALFAAGPERYVWVAFLVVALFSFPSRIPAEGFAGMVALGRLCSRRNLAWLSSNRCRSVLNLRPLWLRRISVSLQPIP